MRKIDLLRDLQEIDQRLDSARADLVQVKRDIGNRASLDQRAAELAQVVERTHRVEAAQRDLELEADTHRIKMTADERKLYGGTVTNPKELEALTQEVAQSKRQLDGIEDKLLEIMDQSDELSRQRSELEALLTRETADWNARQADLAQRVERLDNTVADGEARRGPLLDQIDPPTRSLYDTLRRQKNGTAVAPVLQRTCQACRVTLTPAIEQRARIGADLVACPSCGRVLYIPIG